MWVDGKDSLAISTPVRGSGVRESLLSERDPRRWGVEKWYILMWRSLLAVIFENERLDQPADDQKLPWFGNCRQRGPVVPLS